MLCSFPPTIPCFAVEIPPTVAALVVLPAICTPLMLGSNGISAKILIRPEVTAPIPVSVFCKVFEPKIYPADLVTSLPILYFSCP